jgi:hypothetical protein
MDDKKRDIEMDQQFGNYLDVIYQKLGLDIKRVSYDEDQDMQLKGVDIIQDIDGCSVYIDEKARQRSANSTVNDKTFTFEITAYPVEGGSRRAGNNPYNGWFVDQKQKSVEYHLIVNIQKDQSRYLHCDIYKVKKSDIKNALNGIGLTDTVLITLATDLRNEIEHNDKDSICYKRNKGSTGYLYYLLALRQAGGRCSQCQGMLTTKKGKYGQYLTCVKNCIPKEKFWPNHGLMFYTDSKDDSSNVPELPINLVLNFDFLINHCNALKIN